MSINLLTEVQKLKQHQRQVLEARMQQELANIGENYEPLHIGVNAILNHPAIAKGIDILKSRLGDQRYKPHHFGRVAMVPLKMIYINIDIQRFVEELHIGNNIIPNFDPRLVQPVNLVFRKELGFYTCWDGRQTSSTILILFMYGLIDVNNWEDFEIKANIIDSDLEVPAPITEGAEAIGNFGFRWMDGSGKKPIDQCFIMRSEYHGAKLYNSKMREDLHSMEMWECMLRHGMHPADNRTKSLPGYVPHISGMKKMAGHDTDNFDIETFGKTIKFLSEFVSEDSGVNSSFYMAIADLFCLLTIQGIQLGTGKNQFNEKRFGEFLHEKYGRINTSHEFRRIAKKRLERVRKKQGFITANWDDNCGAPFMLDDYSKWCEKHGLSTGKLPEHPHMHEFVL